MRRRTRTLALALGLGATACGGSARRGEPPPPRLTAEAEVLGIAKVWQALEEEHGTRGPGHKVASYDLKQRTTLTFQQGQGVAHEKIEVKERFLLRSGASYECRASGLVNVRVRFGRKSGEPAVEVHRPSAILSRTCQPSDFPEPELQLLGASARFVLQDERLVGFAPPSERRVFLPLP